ncbi:hypothetical protein SAMN05428970_0246 [Agromyces sp. CF514]|uniref:hypothetical protein n=1 Tax=Agromyces sp. CF514 TaxID=1881031 RepID=UPI0008E2B23B|nr:hypothetical protein [Agromyces sp. CF514]SFR67639.1 hypothetical protein SAMN05428970_0246 [Agromyces sp. CF514]
MTDSNSTEAEYLVEYVDGPLAGTTERRALIDGEVEERIASIAAVRGLESIFWYTAGDEREAEDGKVVEYRFDAPDSDPVQSEKDDESI